MYADTLVVGTTRTRYRDTFSRYIPWKNFFGIAHHFAAWHYDATHGITASY